MPNVISYTATNARRDLFEILNMVRYGDAQVRITKNNRPVARIIKDIETSCNREGAFSYFGKMSDENYVIMKKVTRENRRLPARATKIHKL